MLDLLFLGAIAYGIKKLWSSSGTDPVAHETSPIQSNRKARFLHEDDYDDFYDCNWQQEESEYMEEDRYEEREADRWTNEDYNEYYTGDRNDSSWRDH